MEIPTVDMITEHGGHRLVVHWAGNELETPPVEHLAFYAGLATLAALGFVELPIVIAIGLGHFLHELTQRPALSALGEALSSA